MTVPEELAILSEPSCSPQLSEIYKVSTEKALDDVQELAAELSMVNTLIFFSSFLYVANTVCLKLAEVAKKKIQM